MSTSALIDALQACPDEELHTYRLEVVETLEAQSSALLKVTTALEAFVEHFGPLEDNHMLAPEVRRCIKLARIALGKDEK